MRHLLLPALVILAIPGFAQTEAPPASTGAPGSAGRIQVVDDKDPFEPNAFTGSFRMEMHGYKNEVEEANGPVNMHYWSSPEMSLVGMAADNMHNGPGTDLKFLTDHKNKWSYILMTDPKGNKTAMKSPKKKYIVDADEKKKQAANITVTKETKVIDGYTCTKVIATLEEGTWTGWVTRDIAVPFSDIASTMSRNAMARGSRDWEGLTGFPLEFEMASPDGKKTMHAFVKDLHVGDVDPGVFSITGYKVMEMPGMMPPLGDQ